MPVVRDDATTTDEDTRVSISVLTNDIDVDGDSLTVQGVSQGTHGTVVFNVSGTITYTPMDDFNGTDTFTYTVSDGQGSTATGTVAINVVPVNDAPTATSVAIVTDAGRPSTGVTPFVQDVDMTTNGDTHTYRIITPPVHGTASVVSSDQASRIRLAWDAHHDPRAVGYRLYYGPTSTPYAFTVDVGNQTTYTLAELAAGQIYYFAVTAYDAAGNESDFSTELRYHLPEALHLVYTPEAGFHGTDSFTYAAIDTGGASVTGIAQVTVNAINNAPMAVDDTWTIVEDTGSAIPVLANDTDLEGDILTVAAVLQGDNGTVVTNGVEAIYMPHANFHGVDSFTYTVSDSHGGMATGRVAILVQSMNDVPVAGDDTAVTSEGIALTTTNVLANDTDVDGDSLHVMDFTEAVHGTVRNNNDGTFTYTPHANFHGVDGFTYTVSDGNGGIAVGRVTIRVLPANNAPVAESQNVNTAEDTAKAITLTGHDADGDFLTFTIVTPPVHGVLSGTAPNVTYTPAPDYNGLDSFRFAVHDGVLDSAVATVSLMVAAVNDAPVGDPQNVMAGSAAVELMLTGDDVDGDPLTFMFGTLPINGTLSGEPPVVTYTPHADSSTRDSFTFIVNDGNLDSSPVTVSITAWAMIGDVQVEALTSRVFLSTAGPFEPFGKAPGNAVSTSSLETFLGLAPGHLDSLVTGIVIEGSAVQHTFTAQAGDVLSFDWNFLTDEYTNLDPGGPDPSFNDFAFFTIDSLSLLASTLSTFSSSWRRFFGETGFDTVSFTIPASGTYTLQIGVMDVGDEANLSGLLIKNVLLTPASELMFKSQGFTE